jgi:radical SAM protein with 4Fe4S-binding SPASM domain
MDRKQFKKIYVEITNTCNLHCSFCPPGNRQSGFMSLALFTEVIKKIQGHTKYIYLHVKGEPLLHPQLSEMLDLCHENKINVVLVTNGTLLAERGELLLTKPALRQINISLHCFSELQEKKNKNDYIKVVLAFARKTISKTDKLISLRLWNYEKDNRSRHPDNQIIINEIEQEFAPGLGLIHKLTPGVGLKLKDRLFINTDIEFSWPALSNNFDNTAGTCYGLRNQLAVLYNGIVVPCCLDANGDINLGNIQDNEIQQIFDSERAQKIYNGFLNAKRIEPLCRKCRFGRKNLKLIRDK